VPISTAVVPVTTTAVATIVQLCSFPTAATSSSEATTTDHTLWFSVPPLREDRPRCSRFQPSEARQLTASSSNHGESTEGPTEGPTPWFVHANYTTMEDIPMGEEVLAGTIFLNRRHIVILFDSGASHDFMSSVCANKAKLSLVSSRIPYVISTLGGHVDADILKLNNSTWLINMLKST
jgi:hypothetical protein